MMPYRIRWMNASDLSTVLAIEQASFPRPWTERDFQVHARRRTIGRVLVVRDPVGHERVAGYSVYELHRDRFHVLNLAVDPAYRRHAFGRALLDCLKRRLTPDGRTRVVLDCPDWNVRAHLFYRACGFRAVSIDRDHYVDGDETHDAYRFEFWLGDQAVVGHVRAAEAAL